MEPLSVKGHGMREGHQRTPQCDGESQKETAIPYYAWKVHTSCLIWVFYTLFGFVFTYFSFCFLKNNVKFKKGSRFRKFTSSETRTQEDAEVRKMICNGRSGNKKKMFVLFMFMRNVIDYSNDTKQSIHRFMLHIKVTLKSIQNTAYRVFRYCSLVPTIFL